MGAAQVSISSPLFSLLTVAVAKVMLTCPASPLSPRFPVQLLKICVPAVRVKSNTNSPPPAKNRGILLLILILLAFEPIPNSHAINPLNTVNSVVFLLLLHFLGFCGGGLLATLSSFGFLRSRFGLFAGSRFVYATARSSSGRSRDLGALERVPASAEGAAVLVAEGEGDFVDVELGGEMGCEPGILDGFE